MREAMIVSGGSIDNSFAARYIEEHNTDIKIAVDSGMEFFFETGIRPDIIVGDFDSVRPEVMAYFGTQKEIEFVNLIPEKDDTDTESAIRRAVADGSRRIHLLGATGGRLDHLLGNIHLLGIGLYEGVETFLVDEKNRLRMITEGISIHKKEQHGRFVSLIPFTPEVTGLTLKGMKYPLTDYCLKCFSSLGVSNEILADAGEISFTKGILLVVESED